MRPFGRKQRTGPTRAIHTRLGTEFGKTLRSMVLHTPGALAGVIADEDGDAIDYAHDPKKIDAFDVQLLVAQIGQSMLALEPTYRRHQLLAPVVFLETQGFGLVASSIAAQFVVAMLIQSQANVGLALDRFERSRSKLAALLS